MHNLPPWTRDGQESWVTLAECTATSGLHYAQQSPLEKTLPYGDGSLRGLLQITLFLKLW